MFSQKKVFVIAEIGYNHNGSLNKAKRLVDNISEIKDVDAIKFQIDSPHKIYSSQYGYEGYKFFSSIQLTHEEYFELFDYIKQKGKISFMSISDDDLIDAFVKNGLNLIKISSSSLCNYRILDKIFRYKIPTIASVGVSGFKDMIDIYNEFKNKITKLAFLYCVSMYPTPVNKVSLNNIKLIKTLFPDIPIGYSDHTQKSEVIISSVAFGAKIIEAHVMLDEDSEAIEKDVSYTVSEFKQLVESIRNVETALNEENDNRVVLNESTKSSRKELFRSLYLESDIEAGEKITLDKVLFKRPNLGIPSNLWKMAEGKTLKVKKNKDEPLCWEDLE